VHYADVTGSLVERFSLSVMPPRMLCHDWRYLQAIGSFQQADYDGSDALIYNKEFLSLFSSLAKINVGIDVNKQELDGDGDLRVTFDEFVEWLDRVGLRRIGPIESD